MRYSVAGIRQMLRWRNELAEIDDALRRAVKRRDESLASLGEEVVHDGIGEWGETVSAFAQTLESLGDAHESADQKREELEMELATAESDRREALALFDRRIDDFKSKLRPIERTIDTQQHRMAEIQRTLEAQEGLRDNLHERLRKIAADGVGLSDDDALSNMVAEQKEIERRLEGLEGGPSGIRAEMESLRADWKAARLELTEGEATLDGLRDERRQARHDADSRVDDLRATSRDAGDQAKALMVRRRAALIDLGREVLLQDGGEQPGRGRVRAEKAYIEINRLREQRDRVNGRRLAFDGSPIRRTVIGSLITVGVVFIFWMASRL